MITRLEKNQRLGRVGSYVERMQAIDSLELRMLVGRQRADQSEPGDAETFRLLQSAQALQEKLAAANERLYARLIRSIRLRNWPVVRERLRAVEAQSARTADPDCLQYDELDTLVNGLLAVNSAPAEPEPRDADVIGYQPTPVRIVLRLVDELRLASRDTFYDLGSGLGHVPILINLFTGIKAKGIELEQSYHRYAVACLDKLGLTNVEFINADARQAAYDDGTVFYLYSPFQGETLHHVLRRLAARPNVALSESALSARVPCR